MANISLRDCYLTLPVYGTINRSLKGAVLSATTGGRVASRSRQIQLVHALRGITLDIQMGDRIGLVGHNGAGKTSLLRMLAGIYEPTSGACSVIGKVVSLLDVTLGMDYESTGYENIVLRGLMHGLSKRNIVAAAPEIAEFSELGDYLYMPVRVYSSGMLLRLAFSIATALSADIILMDEWLSVGDSSFVAKAERRLQEMVKKASILVLASHSQDVVNSLCNRVVHLEHGRVVRIVDEERNVGAIA